MLKPISLTPAFALPPLVLGLWRLTNQTRDDAALRRLLHTALDVGIDTLDLADIYGGYQCQPQLGQALVADAPLRKRLRMISKCGIRPVSAATPDVRVKHYDSTAAHIQASVDQSLHDLGVEQLALLLIHRPDPLMNADATAAALLHLIAQGKVAQVGVSNFSPGQWDLLASRLPEGTLVTNQVELSLAHTAPLLDGSFEALQQRRVTPMIWSPLGGGKVLPPAGGQPAADLSTAEDAATTQPLHLMLGQIAQRMGLSPMQVALAWLRSLPLPVVTVLGTHNAQRVQEVAQTAQVVLVRQDWFALLEASRGQSVP